MENIKENAEKIKRAVDEILSKLESIKHGEKEDELDVFYLAGNIEKFSGEIVEYLGKSLDII